MLRFTSLCSNLLLLHAAAATSLRSVTWYAGYHSEGFPLTEVSWSKYTQLAYAFATTTSDVNTLLLAESDEELLPQFVQLAHENNVNASLSIGGWGGSQYFSTAVGSSANRTAFVKTVTALATQYDLDGLDFDWEYPNFQGIGCNTINSNDTVNFLSFLQELRQDSIGSKLVLSAATSLLPWNDTSGHPSKDVSGFSKVLDFIEIMNYDVYDVLSTHAGPNSPLNDTCAPSGDQTGSAVSSVAAWTAAGMPASQIVLGVAAYGHSFIVPESSILPSSSSSNITSAFPSFNASAEHVADVWDSPGGVDICGNYSGPTGVYTYWGLVDDGYVSTDGSPMSGFGYLFDNCSQTPYVYDKSNQTLVSYDNVQSFALKGEFIKNMGLGGFAMWEAGGDLNDTLLDSIRSGMGNTSSSDGPSISSPSSSSNAATTMSCPGTIPTIMMTLSALFLGWSARAIIV